MTNKLYHEGELAIQDRAQKSHHAISSSTIIRESIPEGALSFIQQQVMVVIGSTDDRGQVWASTLFGFPGFIRATDNRTLIIDIKQNVFVEGDPLQTNLKVNAPLGLLVIETASRRRLRISGRISTLSPTEINICVERAYPNCPKYIQRRDLSPVKGINNKFTNSTLNTSNGVQLNDSLQKLIATSDTFFVASAHPIQGIDASHRGGHAGFVCIVNSTKLRIPDFSGNNMFNTLGNFKSYPHAGLIFIDYTTGHILQLSGIPKILWDYDDPRNESGGTKRYWEFEITQWRASHIPQHFTCLYRSEYLDSSPDLPVLKT